MNAGSRREAVQIGNPASDNASQRNLTMESAGGVLAGEGGHKSFGANEVLKGISLATKKHEVISILGSGGSERSTFLRCTNVLETPDSGVIRANGETICFERGGGRVQVDARTVRALRRNMTTVFQQFNLWARMTVLGTVTFALTHVLHKPKKEVEVKALAQLEEVGMDHKLDTYPIQLSGRQQQSVAIARPLAMESAQSYTLDLLGVAGVTAFYGEERVTDGSLSYP
jgi:ABC-type histidine transport system ATPase subunit